VKQQAHSTGGRKPLPPERIFLATLMAWLVPGAGHWMLGMRRKAAVYFASVLGLFLTGAVLGNLTIVSFKYHPYAFLLHACTGVAAVVLSFVTSFMKDVPNPTRWGDIATALTWIAGAFNVLLVADVLDRANGGPFEAEKPKPTWTRRVLLRLLGRKKCSST